MRLTILTTITNPIERQDCFIQALKCYEDLADEVVVVNGGKKIVILGEIFSSKIKFVDLKWPFEWNWIEYPRHLNYGLQYCTGDWVLRLDIDQFIHEKDFDELRKKLSTVPEDCQVVSMQKMSYTYSGRYYQKGSTNIIIRRIPEIIFGKLMNEDTDLCFPIIQKGIETITYEYDYLGDKVYSLPIGINPKIFKSGISYHNYDYYFRDQYVTKREFWRASRAWNRYFRDWKLGSNEDAAFKIFCKMIKARHDNTELRADGNTHSKYIRDSVKQITEDRLGFNGWGIL